MKATILHTTAALLPVIAAVGCVSPSHHHDHGAEHGHSHGEHGSHGHSHGKHGSHGHSHGEQAKAHGHVHGEHGHSHGAAGAVPQDAWVAQRRAIAGHMEAHDFTGTLRRIDALLAQRPSDLWAHQLRSDALVELGRVEEAEASLQRVLDLKPTGAAYMRASYLMHLRGDAAAVEVSRLAVEACAAKQERAWACAELGELLWQRGDLDGAQGAFTAALRDAPGLGRATLGLGRVLAARGEWTRAAALYRAAATTPRDLGELASLYRALGHSKAARRTVDRALAMVRADREHWARSAAVALADHDLEPELAVTLAREELARRGCVRGHDALAWALVRAGRPQEALAAAEQALSLGTREPLMLFHAGMAAAAAGEDAKAAAWLGAALEINPDFHVQFPALARETLRKVSKKETL